MCLLSALAATVDLFGIAFLLWPQQRHTVSCSRPPVAPERSPSVSASETVCFACRTTGISIILLPSATTPLPDFFASSKAKTIVVRFQDLRPRLGVNTSWTTCTCRGWMHPIPLKPNALDSAALTARHPCLRHRRTRCPAAEPPPRMRH